MFLPIEPGIFNSVSAHGDEVMDELPDGLTDQSDDVQMEGILPRYFIFDNCCTGILIDIFTMDLADGRTDGTDDRHTAFQTEFQVELHFGWQTDKSWN